MHPTITNRSNRTRGTRKAGHNRIVLERPGRLFATWESVLERRGTLTTGTTVFQGPNEAVTKRSNRAAGGAERLLKTGATELEGPGTLLTTRETVLEGPVRLLTTWTTVLKGPERLLTTWATVLGVPGRLFKTWESVLEGQGRLVTEGETVLEKPGTLTTGTTVLQGPMMLLIAGETVLEWPGGGGGDCKLSDCRPSGSAARLEMLCKQTCAGRMGLKDQGHYVFFLYFRWARGSYVFLCLFVSSPSLTFF